MYQSVPTVGHPGLHLRLLPSIFSMIYQSSPSKDLLKHIKDVPQSTGEPGVSVTSLYLFWKTTIRICIFCCCINYIWRRFFISRKRKSEHQVISCQPTRLGKVWIQRHQYIYIMNFVDSLHLLIQFLISVLELSAVAVSLISIVCQLLRLSFPLSCFCQTSWLNSRCYHLYLSLLRSRCTY